MRNLSILISLTLLMAGSCKKETTTTPIIPPVITTPNNEINTEIDGVEWSGTILSWAISGGTRQLNASSNGTSIQIFMPEDTTGTFTAVDDIITVSYNDGTTTWSNNISGQVELVSNSSDLVEGTFELTIGSYFNSDTLTFTSGSFYFK